jgi:DNA-binding transcriptional regulator GbsR (MarR family)
MPGMATVLTPAQSGFIEEMGQFLGGYGMTPMAGRMWGWLLLCEPPEQTAADIAEALQASRGAISGTARILTSAGFIRRTTRRGDRREYFSSPPEALDSMLSNASVVYRRLREIAEHGLAAADDSASAEARLREFRDVVAFIEAELPRLIEGFLKDRATAGTMVPAAAGGRDSS